MPRRELIPEPRWNELLARLGSNPNWHSLLVLGAVDSGKTTLVRFLGSQLAARAQVMALDCDPGQSTIGPPTTTGLAREPRGNGAAPLALSFVGSTSPAGNYMAALAGARQLLDLSSELDAESVVIDAPGYYETGGGREFHLRLVELLRPDHIVALQRDAELEALLACWTHRSIFRFPISTQVIARDAMERQAYRTQRWRDYFETATVRTLDLSAIGIAGWIPDFSAHDWLGRLVAPCDARGFALTIGILEDADPSRRKLTIWSPAWDIAQVARVQFGSTRLLRSGEET